MSTKNYIPKAVFQTLKELTEHYKTIQSAEKPYALIEQWLAVCFEETVIPEFGQST